MTIFKHIPLLLLITLVLTSCASAPEIKTVIVYKTQDVYIPTPCDVQVECDFKGEGYSPTSKLLECLIKQKRALDYCKQITTPED